MNRDHAAPPPAWAAPAETEVLHGYTLGRLQALARTAAATAWSQAADYDSRLEDAWYGVAAHLAAADRPPAPRDLVDARRRRAAGIQPRNLVTPERRAAAAQLRAQGLSWQKVGEALGMSQASAIRAVNGRAPAREAAL